jgi:hypothetical protein
MELTLKEIVNAAAVINVLAQRKPKNQKCFYWIALAQRKLIDYVETYDRARRNLLAKYGTEPEKGKTEWTFNPPENKQKFTEEIEALLKEKFTIEINPCPFLRLVEDEPLAVTPENITMLGPLVTLEDPDEKEE